MAITLAPKVPRLLFLQRRLMQGYDIEKGIWNESTRRFHGLGASKELRVDYSCEEASAKSLSAADVLYGRVVVGNHWTSALS